MKNDDLEEPALRSRLAGIVRPHGFSGTPADSDRRVVLSMLVAFMLLWIPILAVVAQCLLMPGTPWPSPGLFILLAIEVLLAVAFVVNRRCGYLPAALLTVGALLAGVLLGVQFTLLGMLEPYLARDSVNVLAYLLLPLILAAVFLPMRLSLIAVLLSAVYVMLVPMMHPQITLSALLRGPLFHMLGAGLLFSFLLYVAIKVLARQYHMIERRGQRYHQLFDQSPAATCLFSMDGTLEAINAAGLTLFGYGRVELEGKSARHIHALPDERTALILKLEREETLVDEPLRMRRKDGLIIDCLADVRVRRDRDGCPAGYEMVVRDVSARVKLDEELRLKAQMLDLAVDVVLLLDPGGEIVYANRSVSELTGYSIAELTGMNIRCLDRPEDAAQVPSRISAVIQKGEHHFETVWMSREGRYLNMEVHGHAVQSGGQWLMAATALDITRRKLDESELTLRSELLDSASDIVLLHDYSGKLSYTNQAAAEQSGYSRQELLGMNLRELYDETAWRSLNSGMTQLANWGTVAFEGGYRRKDGLVIPVDVRSRVVEWQDRDIVLAIVRDISERRKAELELQSSEQRYRSLVEQSLDGFWAVRADGSGHEVNQAWLDMFGYTREELAGLNAVDLYVNPADRQAFISRMEHAHAIRDQVKFRRKDGAVLICERAVVARRNAEGHIVGFQGVLRDITERVTAEESLRQSEERYRSLFQQSMDAIFVCTPDGTPIEANQAWLDLLGYTQEELHTVNAIDLYTNPTERAQFLEQMSLKGMVADEVRYQRKDGMILEVQRVVSSLKDQYGKVVAFQGVTHDVTERKRAERRLLESEERFRNIMSSMQDIVFTLDREQRHTGVYGPWVEASGLTPQAFLGKTAEEFFGPGADEAHREANLRAFEGEFVVYDWSAALEDGIHYYQTSLSPIRDTNGEVKGLVGVGREITQLRRVEDELRRNEERYRSLFQQSMNAILVSTPDGAVIDANQAWLDLFGYTREELEELNIIEMYVDPAEPTLFLDRMNRQGMLADEVLHRRKDGTVLEIQRAVTALKDEGGSVIAFQSVVRDITERKRAELELRESEAKFRALVEYTGLGMAITTTDGEVIECNSVLPEMLGYTREEMLSLSLREAFASEQTWEAVVSQGLRDGHVRDTEVECKRKDGSTLFISMTMALVPMHGRTVAVSQLLDVTARREAQDELLRSREELRRSAAQLHELASYLEEAREEERTGIARELHDQLGQALTALKLDLAAIKRASASGEALSADHLEQMMALLDETVDDVRRISSELRPGILDDAGLLAAIEWQLERFRERSSLACQLESSADDSELDRASSTALFRVFQELLVNIARHASASSVMVRFEKYGGSILLSVSDDGRGITRDQVDSASSLGIIGMRERLRPLGGSIEFQRNHPRGTVVRVRVPLAPVLPATEQD